MERAGRWSDKSLCWCPESQQDSWGWGGEGGIFREGGLSQKKNGSNLDGPPRLYCDRRDREQLNLFGCFLFHLWIRCKQVHPPFRLHSSRSDGENRTWNWTEKKGEKKSSGIWRLVLVERRCWLSGTRDRGGGFNCGVGCTFHSALFQAGSWRCSGGRTTWRRRRRAPRGPPSPHNPGSWRAVRQRYLEAPETHFIFSS